MLKQVARTIGAELETKGFDYWFALDMHENLHFTRDIEGQTVNVDVVKLSCNAEYVQLGVAVDDGGFLNARIPPGISAVVMKHP